MRLEILHGAAPYRNVPVTFTLACAIMSPRLAKILGWSTVTLMLVMLGFRFAVYRHLHIAPGDPYGISDVIEFYLGCALVVALGVSGLGAVALLVVGPRANRAAAGWLMVTCVAVLVLALPLHHLAVRFAL